MANYRFSEHALKEMAKRQIDRSQVIEVIKNPMQKVPEHLDVICLQSKVQIQGKPYLLRVMVNENKTPPLIVTVYRTSKIDKYWRSV